MDVLDKRSGAVMLVDGESADTCCVCRTYKLRYVY